MYGAKIPKGLRSSIVETDDYSGKDPYSKEEIKRSVEMQEELQAEWHEDIEQLKENPVGEEIITCQEYLREERVKVCFQIFTDSISHIVAIGRMGL